MNKEQKKFVTAFAVTLAGILIIYSLSGSKKSVTLKNNVYYQKGYDDAVSACKAQDKDGVQMEAHIHDISISLEQDLCNQSLPPNHTDKDVEYYYEGFKDGNNFADRNYQ